MDIGKSIGTDSRYQAHHHGRVMAPAAVVHHDLLRLIPIIRIRCIVALSVLCTLSGCASVPITSMIQLASMGRDWFEQVDPAEIRVRVSVSPGFEIDVERTTLGLSIDRPGRPVRDEKLTLELIERTTMERSLGFMRGSASMPTLCSSLDSCRCEKVYGHPKNSTCQRQSCQAHVQRQCAVLKETE